MGLFNRNGASSSSKNEYTAVPDAAKNSYDTLSKIRENNGTQVDNDGQAIMYYVTKNVNTGAKGAVAVDIEGNYKVVFGSDKIGTDVSNDIYNSKILIAYPPNEEVMAKCEEKYSAYLAQQKQNQANINTAGLRGAEMNAKAAALDLGLEK